MIYDLWFNLIISNEAIRYEKQKSKTLDNFRN